MKDYLQDIIAHTNPVKEIDLVKITGSDTETTVTAVPPSKSVIMFGKFKNPNPDFKGVFGMPNLDRLNTILNIPEYKACAITFSRINYKTIDIYVTPEKQVKNIEIIKKMQNSKGGAPGTPAQKPAVDSTQIKKG